jgi:hypothetical protein
MRKLTAVTSLCALALVSPSKAQAPAPAWNIVATVAESCSCTIACPCNFGGRPNRTPCEGNRLISIASGRYEGVDLGGVAFIVTFNMGSWSKVYVSDRVTEPQMKAVEALMPIAFAGFHKGMLSFTKAPITMQISESVVRFSGPESSVEMEVMRGFGGQPVKILNLPSAAYQDYTQYRSTSHQHKSAEHNFSHTGTNGFTSTMKVGGKQ